MWARSGLFEQFRVILMHVEGLLYGKRRPSPFDGVEHGVKTLGVRNWKDIQDQAKGCTANDDDDRDDLLGI